MKTIIWYTIAGFIIGTILAYIALEAWSLPPELKALSTAGSFGIISVFTIGFTMFGIWRS